MTRERDPFGNGIRGDKAADLGDTSTLIERARTDPRLYRLLMRRRQQAREQGVAAAGPSASGPVQAKLTHETADPETVQAAAGAAVSSSGGAFPHGQRIQDSFGHHRIADAPAHTGSDAGSALRDAGMQAVARDGHAAFDGTPDLHTAAHEAAHLVQQSAVLQLPGGVGSRGDAHEQHADAVADLVVQGRSSEQLLDRYGGGAAKGGASGAVQARFTQAGAAVAPDELARVRALVQAHNPLLLVDFDAQVSHSTPVPLQSWLRVNGLGQVMAAKRGADEEAADDAADDEGAAGEGDRSSKRVRLDPSANGQPPNATHGATHADPLASSSSSAAPATMGPRIADWGETVATLSRDLQTPAGQNMDDAHRRAALATGLSLHSHVASHEPFDLMSAHPRQSNPFDLRQPDQYYRSQAAHPMLTMTPDATDQRQPILDAWEDNRSNYGNNGPERGHVGLRPSNFSRLEESMTPDHFAAMTHAPSQLVPATASSESESESASSSSESSRSIADELGQTQAALTAAMLTLPATQQPYAYQSQHNGLLSESPVERRQERSREMALMLLRELAGDELANLTLELNDPNPNLTIHLTAFANSAAPQETKERIAEWLQAYFAGSVALENASLGLPLELQIRQSFGFLDTSVANTAMSLRLSFGNEPPDMLRGLAAALRKLDTDIGILANAVAKGSAPKSTKKSAKKSGQTSSAASSASKGDGKLDHRKDKWMVSSVQKKYAAVFQSVIQDDGILAFLDWVYTTTAEDLGKRVTGSFDDGRQRTLLAMSHEAAQRLRTRLASGQAQLGAGASEQAAAPTATTTATATATTSSLSSPAPAPDATTSSSSLAATLEDEVAVDESSDGRRVSDALAQRSQLPAVEDYEDAVMLAAHLLASIDRTEGLPLAETALLALRRIRAATVLASLGMNAPQSTPAERGQAHQALRCAIDDLLQNSFLLAAAVDVHAHADPLGELTARVQAHTGNQDATVHSTDSGEQALFASVLAHQPSGSTAGSLRLQPDADAYYELANMPKALQRPHKNAETVRIADVAPYNAQPSALGVAANQSNTSSSSSSSKVDILDATNADPFSRDFLESIGKSNVSMVANSAVKFGLPGDHLQQGHVLDLRRQEQRERQQQVANVPMARHQRQVLSMMLDLRKANEVELEHWLGAELNDPDALYQQLSEIVAGVDGGRLSTQWRQFLEAVRGERDKPDGVRRTPEQLAEAIFGRGVGPTGAGTSSGGQEGGSKPPSGGTNGQSQSGGAHGQSQSGGAHDAGLVGVDERGDVVTQVSGALVDAYLRDIQRDRVYLGVGEAAQLAAHFGVVVPIFNETRSPPSAASWRTTDGRRLLPHRIATVINGNCLVDALGIIRHGRHLSAVELGAARASLTDRGRAQMACEDILNGWMDGSYPLNQLGPDVRGMLSHNAQQRQAVLAQVPKRMAAVSRSSSSSGGSAPSSTSTSTTTSASTEGAATYVEMAGGGAASSNMVLIRVNGNHFIVGIVQAEGRAQANATNDNDIEIEM